MKAFDMKQSVIDPFDIPPMWRIDRALAWGYVRDLCVLWFAESDGVESPRDTLFIIRELCQSGMRIDEVASLVTEIDAEFSSVSPGPADSQVDQIVEQAVSIRDSMEAMGVHWTKADRRPGSRSRAFSSIRYRLTEKPPTLYIFNTCASTVETLDSAGVSDDGRDVVINNGPDNAYEAIRNRVNQESGVYQ